MLLKSTLFHRAATEFFCQSTMSSKIIKLSGGLFKKTVREIVDSKELAGVQWKRYADLNPLIKGFRPGELTILSGRSGSGKTTFLCEYSLDLCEQHVPTLWGSFEISVHKLCATLLHQFSGKDLSLVTPLEVQKWAAAFELLPMYFLNMHGAQSDSEVFQTLYEGIEAHGLQHVILDNLQFMLGCRGNSFGEQFAIQDRFVQDLRTFVTKTGCHVTTVVHPRKEDCNRLLSINSIYGGGKVSQEADNVMLLQQECDIAMPKKFIQLVKNRYDGTLGKIALQFNRQCRSYRPLDRSRVPIENVVLGNQ